MLPAVFLTRKAFEVKKYGPSDLPPGRRWIRPLGVAQDRICTWASLDVRGMLLVIPSNVSYSSLFL